MKRILVHVEDGDRLAERRPDAVVIDPAGHHQNEHLVIGDRPGRHHLDLHGGVGWAMPLLANGPGVHLRRHMAERRYLADGVKVLARC
jgi:hypothetical protein